jgi:hypothetical protein
MAETATVSENGEVVETGSLSSRTIGTVTTTTHTT